MVLAKLLLTYYRLPFCLQALTAVKQNMGLAVVAYFFCFVAFAWSVFWVVGLTSSMMTIGQGIIFLYLVSFYWVHQVLVNTVHTTTAGKPAIQSMAIGFTTLDVLKFPTFGHCRYGLTNSLLLPRTYLRS